MYNFPFSLVRVSNVLSLLAFVCEGFFFFFFFATCSFVEWIIFWESLVEDFFAEMTGKWVVYRSKCGRFIAVLLRVACFFSRCQGSIFIAELEFSRNHILRDVHGFWWIFELIMFTLFVLVNSVYTSRS